MEPTADPGSKSAPPRPRWLHNPWLPALLGAACFANTLTGGLTYDDRPLVLDNPRIQSLSNFTDLWLTDWWGGVDRPEQDEALRDRLYRPLTLLTLALNYAIHGPQPFGYHLINILLHAAACVLTWYLARRLTGDAAVATLAAVLFAVHPVHAEAVASVVGRAEILATASLLGGVLLLLRDRQSWQRSSLAALLFLLALLAKETAICYPALALLILLTRPVEHRPRGTAWLVHGAILLVPLVIYFPLRYIALEHHLVRVGSPDLVMNPVVGAEGLDRLFAIFTVLGHYTRLILVPATLASDYGKAIIAPGRGIDLMTIVGLLAAVAIIVGLGLARRRDRLPRLVALLTALFVASYALISNSVLLIGVAVAERLMYWPSVPLLMLAAVGLVEFARRQCAPGRPLAHRTSALATLGVLVILALGVRTAVRNTDWDSNLALLTADARTYPSGAHLNRGAAMALVDLYRSRRPPRPDDDPHWAVARRHLLHLGFWQQVWSPNKQRSALLRAARTHLDRAIAIYPEYTAALRLRGEVRGELGDYAAALQDIEAVLLIEPDNERARIARRKLHAQLAEPTQSIRDLTAAVATQPANVAARLALGDALLGEGRFDEARVAYEAVLDHEPNNTGALRELGKILALAGENEQARRLFERVVSLDPQDWQAHGNLVRMYSGSDPARALHHAERAYALKPNDVRIAANLAEACVLSGDVARARRLYRDIIQGLPPDDPFASVLAERLRALEANEP